MKKTYFALGLLCALCVFTAAVAVKAVGGFSTDDFRVQVEANDEDVKIVKERIVKRIVEGEAGEMVENVASSEKLAPFKSVHVYGPMHVVYRQGEDYLMELSGDPDDFSHISSKVSGDELALRCDKRGEVDVIVTITAPALEIAQLKGSGGFTAEKIHLEKFKIQSQGSGDVRLSGEVSRRFSLNISGSGDFSGKIDAPEVQIGLAGSGDARLEGRFETVDLQSQGSGDVALEGKARRLSAQIQGSGEVKANNLRVSEGDVSVQGSGDCFVNATDRLNVAIQGSGDVRYVGSPKLTSAVKGSGTVVKE